MKCLCRLLGCVFLLVIFSACETIKAGEHAVVFSKLPWIGGLRKNVLRQGEREIVFPWDEVYKIDTGLQTISWGSEGENEEERVRGYVETRAADGNEVGLAMTVQYVVSPERLHHVIQNVASTNEGIRNLVKTVARADIRTHMNTLRTRDFFNQEQRQKAVTRVLEALQTRFEPEGISIKRVIYDDHRFERRLPDGSIDRSYQEQIDRTQAIVQETQQERKKIPVVIAQKKQEFNEAKAKFNRMVEEVSGFKRQAILRGDAYLKSKENRAKQILAVGMAEVEGLQQQVAALSGPGGRALLRLALVRVLIEQNPQFVLLNSTKQNSGGGLELSQININELIKQAGVFLNQAKGPVKEKTAVEPESVAEDVIPIPIKP